MDQNLGFFISISGRFDWLGNWLFLFIALIECVPFVGAIFPGGTLITIGSFLAAQGLFNIWGLTAFSMIGAVLGDWGGYALGRWGGDWLNKKGLIKAAWLAKGQEFFEQHGAKSILWGRFFGATRAVVPFVAGASKMRQRTFFFWNILSAFLWAAGNIAIGYFSGNLIAGIIRNWSGQLGASLSILTAIALIYWVYKKHGESSWEYFQHVSFVFTEKLKTKPGFRDLNQRYPALAEILSIKKSQEKIFAGFLGLIGLTVFYILALVLDLF